jgi:hypothetical protein
MLPREVDNLKKSQLEFLERKTTMSLIEKNYSSSRKSKSEDAIKKHVKRNHY